MYSCLSSKFVTSVDVLGKNLSVEDRLRLFAYTEFFCFCQFTKRFCWLTRTCNFILVRCNLHLSTCRRMVSVITGNDSISCSVTFVSTYLNSRSVFSDTYDSLYFYFIYIYIFLYIYFIYILYIYLYICSNLFVKHSLYFKNIDPWFNFSR